MSASIVTIIAIIVLLLLVLFSGYVYTHYVHNAGIEYLYRIHMYVFSHKKSITPNATYSCEAYYTWAIHRGLYVIYH